MDIALLVTQCPRNERGGPYNLIRFLLRNCQPLKDHLDDLICILLMSQVLETVRQKVLFDCPGLQAIPWSSMKTLKVAFTCGNVGYGPYLRSFPVSVVEFNSCPTVRTVVDVQDF